MVKGAKDVTTVFVRRHSGLACPVFTAEGELFYSNNGDLWKGTIESEEERICWLDADRYAPLAWLETGEGTPAEMGGSGWGVMLKVPRVANPERKVDGMAQIAELKLGDYKRILEGCKPLRENNRPANLCASPDETKVYYEHEGQSFLVTGGETRELDLTTR
jgi:hypothetical protein